MTSVKCDYCNNQYNETPMCGDKSCEKCTQLMDDLHSNKLDINFMTTDQIKIEWKVIDSNPVCGSIVGGSFKCYLLKIITNDDIVDSELNINPSNPKLRYYFESDNRATIATAKIIRRHGSEQRSMEV